LVVVPTVEAVPPHEHPAPTPLPPLTLKQAAFADAYLLTGNASEAYRRAYDVATMLPKTARDNASVLLRHSGVAAAIASRRAEAEEAVKVALVAAQVGAPEAVARIERIGAMDPEEHAAQLSPILRANESLAGIAGLMPKGNGVTVNVGGDHRRLDAMAMDLWAARKQREREARDKADV